MHKIKKALFLSTDGNKKSFLTIVRIEYIYLKFRKIKKSIVKQQTT